MRHPLCVCRSRSASKRAGSCGWSTRWRTQGGAEAAPIDVDWLEATLPVPSTTDTLLTFDGRWTREKRPVATPMPAGRHGAAVAAGPPRARQPRRRDRRHRGAALARRGAVGRAPRVVERSHVPRRPRHRCGDPDRRRRAAAAGRGPARAGRRVPRAASGVRAQHRRARRFRAPRPHVAAGAAAASVVPAAARAQHLGGRLLRPRSRPARRARRPRGRGRDRAVRARRRLVPGAPRRLDESRRLDRRPVRLARRPRPARRRACTGSACSSACGSSPR